MRKILIIVIALFLSTGVFAQGGNKTTTTKSKTEKTTKSKTKFVAEIDTHIKGPNHEDVYTGPKGGKYYMTKDGKKKYLPKKK